MKTASTMSMMSTQIKSSSTWDIVIDNNTCVITGQGSEFLNTLFSFPTGTDINILHMSPIPGDPNLHIIGGFHVGRHDFPTETSLGRGSAHTIGMSCWAFNGTATYTDRTATWTSHTGSTASFFDGTASGRITYIGGDYTFPGLRIDATTIINMGAGAIAYEYWNGAAWTAFELMNTTAAQPWTRYANSIFTIASQMQFRFGTMTGWATTSVNGTTKYWVRFRITTGITTSPTVERIGLQTNHTEVNSDGIIEYFGAARPRMQFPISKSGGDPSSTNITVDGTMTYFGQDNSYANSASNGRSMVIFLPLEVDTSLGTTFDVFWTSATTGNNFRIRVLYSLFSMGSIFNTNTPSTEIAVTTAGPTSAYLVKKESFSIPINSAVTDSAMMLTFQRLGSDAADTNTGTFLVVEFKWTGYRWSS